jgi:hypothetical protein
MYDNRKKKEKGRKKGRKMSRQSTPVEFRDRILQSRLKSRNINRAVQRKTVFGQH